MLARYVSASHAPTRAIAALSVMGYFTATTLLLGMNTSRRLSADTTSTWEGPCPPFPFAALFLVDVVEELRAVRRRLISSNCSST